ncbi:hypothetical protein LJC63_01200 [Ruminococcaceae bacterium OttesenSCG-928-L11]|nr:hypothetical protein [Ruminococcaceae bacterium OttesenSCG-928-L11]
MDDILGSLELPHLIALPETDDIPGSFQLIDRPADAINPVCAKGGKPSKGEIPFFALSNKGTTTNQNGLPTTKSRYASLFETAYRLFSAI